MTSISGKVVTGAMVKAVVFKPLSLERLSPFASNAVVVDPFPVFQGRPMNPSLWVLAEANVSAEGVAFKGSRLAPEEVDTGAGARFLPVRDKYNVNSSTVDPFSGGGAHLVSTASTMPLIRTQEYVIGDELLRRDSFRFVNGSYLALDLSGIAYTGYAMSFVLSLNSASGDYPIMDFFDHEFAPMQPGKNNRVAIRYTDKIDFMWGGTGGSVDPIAPVSKARPLFITLSVKPPTASIYVSYSHRHMFCASKSSGVVDIVPPKIAVGRSWNEHSSADFDMFEMNVFDRGLTRNEVSSLHSMYITTYGENNAWS